MADRWHVITGAGTLANVQRSTTVRTGALTKYSCEMVGAAGVAAVEIGQRIESIHSARYKRTVAFSCWIYNGSGAAFTPKLLAITPSAADNWTTNSTINGGGLGESLQSCPDAVWTKVIWSADVSGYSNIGNGFGITIQIPSGSLVAGDTVRFAEMNLTPGSAFSPMALTDPVRELNGCKRYYQQFDQGLQGFVQETGANDFPYLAWSFPIEMRSAPTLTIIDTSPTIDQFTTAGVGGTFTGSSSGLDTSATTPLGAIARLNGFTGMTAGSHAAVSNGQTTPVFACSAEL